MAQVYLSDGARTAQGRCGATFARVRPDELARMAAPLAGLPDPSPGLAIPAGGPDVAKPIEAL